MPEQQRCWLILGPWQSRYPDTGWDPRAHVHRLVAVDTDGGHATRVVAWNQLHSSRSVHHIAPDATTMAVDETFSYSHVNLSSSAYWPQPTAMPLALLAPDEAGWL